MKVHILLITMMINCSIAGIAQTITFDIDHNTALGPLKPFREVNIGPDSCRSGYLKMGIPKIRTHDYYGPCDYWYYTNNYYIPSSNSFNPSFNPTLPASYNWIETDSTINRILAVNATPYFRLGISYPHAGTPTIPPIDPNNTTFTTIASVFKHTAMHYTQGWDNGYTHNIEYWEIWNEPDGIFWSLPNGTPLNYYKMYKTASDSLKLLNPDFKIGGPGALAGTIVSHNKTYYDNFINYCYTHNAALDFYSWHLYGCFNPYSIKNYADTVRHVLDNNGFPDAESHITEINPQLGNILYDNTAKGAAHVASVLITGQDAHIDQIYWYRGTGLGKLAFPDKNGQPRLTFLGISYAFFNWMTSETDNRISSTGNQVINFFFNRDTTNVMTLASKSFTGDTVDILVSHYNSTFNEIDLHLNNTPWLPEHLIKIEQYTISGQPTTLTISSHMTTGGNNLVLTTPSMPAPSVLFFRISKVGSVGSPDLKSPEMISLIYPNPAENFVEILSMEESEAYIVDASLRHLRSIRLLPGKNRVDLAGLKPGNYYITNNKIIKKLVVK
jgi:hypothetical protein